MVKALKIDMKEFKSAFGAFEVLDVDYQVFSKKKEYPTNIDVDALFNETNFGKELLEHMKFNDDLEKSGIRFSTENIESGLKVISGVPMVEVWANGDWESEVGFVLYMDEQKQIRAFVPWQGNTFNPLTKSAFGNDEKQDKTFFEEKGIDKDCVWDNLFNGELFYNDFFENIEIA